MKTLDAAHKNRECVSKCVCRMREMGASAETLGMNNLADDLYQMANMLALSANDVCHAVGADVSDNLKAADQASKNMVEAALSVLTKQKGAT